jgi:hypothetical protein
MRPALPSTLCADARVPCLTITGQEEFEMHVTVLAVPGCPNVALVEEQLASVLEGRPGVTVSRHVIADEAEAASRGMHGSPTILINGADPFAEPGQPASMSCRLDRGSDGRISGLPSAGQLRQAIEQAADSDAGADSPSWLDALGRGGRGRIAPSERGLRAVHQAVLRSFAQTGGPPETSLLEDAAAPFDAAQALAELAQGDFLCLDDAGRITVAYPFSALPTAHRVQIAGGASAYAICAIDALGIAPMVDSKAVIQSADPSTGRPITVTVDGSNSEWHPRTAVVFDGRTGSEHPGPSAEICCGYMNFFATRAAAAAWAHAHPAITGGILSQDRAIQVGKQIFGQLLR